MIDEILKYGSVAVVGTAKNVGKTVTMNWLLGELRRSGKRLGLTSVGYDGEGLDQVTETAKPEITLYEGMVFTTAEQQYAGRRLSAEILEIGERRTAVGRPVTARVKVQGKCIVSGPADTYSLRRLIERYGELGVELTMVDGAQSRMSLASPTVTDAMVLATGAALSANVQQVVMQTRYACQLIGIGECSLALKQGFGGYENMSPLQGSIIENPSDVGLTPYADICRPYRAMDRLPFQGADVAKGVWTMSEEGELKRSEVRTALTGIVPEMSGVKAIYVSGAVGDRFVERLMMQRREVELVVSDFTKLFLTQATYARLLRSKVKISVMYKSRLVAVTVNPWSPMGFTMDSGELCERIGEATGVRVFDVMKM